MKRLSGLIKYCNIISIKGSTEKEISGIAYDSRSVERAYAFFALPGVHTDGNRFIKSAFEKGASAVFTEEEPEEYIEGLTYILTDDSRKAMSSFSSAFYDFPSEKLNIIGVTGTDGKSSSVSFIYQLLKNAGYRAGFISTVEYDCTGTIEKNPYRQSTPESPEIMKILSGMVSNRFEYAVVESTSHGLSEKTARLADVKYNCGVLTNISHEHLEFHGTIENYVKDKANLFRKAEDFCVVNGNEKFAADFIKAAKADVYYYYGAGNSDNETACAETEDSSIEKGLSGHGTAESGKNSSAFLNSSKVNAEKSASFTSGKKLKPGASAFSSAKKSKSVFASDIVSDGITTNFNINYQGKKYPALMNIPGIFNVDNILASVLAASLSTGRDMGYFAELVESLRPVTGRMDTIDMGQPFTVIVDYAHTPGAFEKIFPLIKKTVRKKLITVFGSAGERDTEKRPIQGQIAGRYSDIVILADEDPRGEDAVTILKDIKAGIDKDFNQDNIYLIPDRQEAIKKAVSIAQEGDTVIMLGKGHESSIIYADGKIEWNERKAAEKALSDAGYGK